MIRPGESLEVYKQKQNILFIYESVEHRRSKVSWARLWVCSDVCTAECACRAYAWPSACRVLRHMHGPAIRDDGLDGRTAWRFVRLGSDILFARLGWARGSVGRSARLGRDVVVEIFVHRRKHEQREQNRGVHRCTCTHSICNILIIG